MKTFRVIIEETISQAFNIKAETIEDAIEIARNDYRNGFLIVDNGNLVESNLMAEDEETNKKTDWEEL